MKRPHLYIIILAGVGIISVNTVYATVTTFTDNVVTNPGNIGILNTNPQTPLSVGSLSPGSGEAVQMGSIQIATSGGLASTSGGLEFKSSSYQNGYGWRITAPDTFSSAATPLIIQDRANSATWTEIMRIATNGNVGIGNTNPQTPLSVGSLSPGSGEATQMGSIQIATSGGLASTSGGLEFKSSSYQNGYGWRITAPDTFSSAATPLIIQDRTNSATWTEIMRIATNGNVGIGNTNPQEKLDVTGNIRLSGNIVSPNDICIGTC